jgi:hypothetical protein
MRIYSICSHVELCRPLTAPVFGSGLGGYCIAAGTAEAVSAESYFADAGRCFAACTTGSPDSGPLWFHHTQHDRLGENQVMWSWWPFEAAPMSVSTSPLGSSVRGRVPVLPRARSQGQLGQTGPGERYLERSCEARSPVEWVIALLTASRLMSQMP